MKSKIIASIILLYSFTTFAFATECNDQYFKGASPKFLNEKSASHTIPLCFDGFAIMHSGISRTPLWSAEHLTKVRLGNARQLKRQNSFHPEDRLPASHRAELKDYQGSGYDRGHMAPSADMGSRSSQNDSFSLANMIPQNPNNNQNLWEGIESSTRELAKRSGEIYVITGPMFEGRSISRLRGRVLVPTAIFKAVYDPRQQAAAAYIASNEPGMAYTSVSIAELEKRIGINLYPLMSDAVKSRKMSLPEPKPHGFNNRDNGNNMARSSTRNQHSNTASADPFPSGHQLFKFAKNLLR